MIGLKKPIVIFLMGATTTGKTDFAILLSKYLPIDIISVDSVLIYKNMNIGTAKPSCKILNKIPHKLINIKDPIESYSVFEFQNDAIREINNSIALNRIPFLVGGTMLYYYVLLHGLYCTPPESAYFKTKIFSCVHNKEKIKNFYNLLKKIDPKTALLIHKNDIKRIARALNIYFNTGQLVSNLKLKKKNRIHYEIIQFAMISSDRIEVHKKIKNRFENMLKMGFEEEVIHLFNRGDLNINCPSIRSVGYRQMWNYLNKKISYLEMKNQAIYATCQLYKKQLTWIKKWKDVCFLNSDNKKLAIDTFFIVLKNNMILKI
ncbi:tRNA dimethylallyltransferase [Buchnera aphidicola (Thelaxes suberi)]|uniref:tRNA (adenosine(37)-N6)-dimethylallyltransferase MiaA n=1 Tax=Buchnera aphidicola TaxID=9 RepID=UPI003464E7F0